MTGFLNAVSACAVLLMMMAVGYFMGARGWMTAREKKFVSLFIINIAVPCNCLVGLLENLDRSGLAQAGVQLVSGLAGVAVTLLVSMAAAWLLRLPRERWGFLWLWPGCPTPFLSASPCVPSSLARPVCPT